MITGVDYILYTDKSQDALIEKIKETIPFWGNPYFVIAVSYTHLTLPTTERV